MSQLAATHTARRSHSGRGRWWSLRFPPAAHQARQPPEPRGPDGTRRDAPEARTSRRAGPGRRALLTGAWGAPVRPPERGARGRREPPPLLPGAARGVRGRGPAAREAASPGGDPRRAPAGPRRLRKRLSDGRPRAALPGRLRRTDEPGGAARRRRRRGELRGL